MKVKGWDHTDRVVKALDERRVLKINYKRISDGKMTTREIEPVFVSTRDCGYDLMVGYCRLREDYRTFRVDSIKNSLLKYETFDPARHIRRAAALLLKSVNTTNHKDLNAVAREVRRQNINVLSV